MRATKIMLAISLSAAMAMPTHAEDGLDSEGQPARGRGKRSPVAVLVRN
jgi:hypothetical protein